jgi:hypothetical protein
VLPALIVLVLLATPAPARAAGEASVVGKPAVSPGPVAPGRPAELTVTLRAGGKPTPPVQLEVRLGGAVVGKLADKPLGANQTRAFKIPISVPAGVTGLLDLRVLGWGAELARVSAPTPERSAAPASAATKPPAAAAPGGRPAGPPPVASVTQTLTTRSATLIGDRGVRPAPPPPTVTQTLTTAAASLTGNRGAQPPPPPPPSVTQTVTTPAATLTGDR